MTARSRGATPAEFTAARGPADYAVSTTCLHAVISGVESRFVHTVTTMATFDLKKAVAM